MKRNAFIAMVTVAATLTAVAAELPPDIFRKGEKILFIGDSITHGGRKGDMNHYLGRQSPVSPRARPSIADGKGGYHRRQSPVSTSESPNSIRPKSRIRFQKSGIAEALEATMSAAGRATSSLGFR